MIILGVMFKDVAIQQINLKIFENEIISLNSSFIALIDVKENHERVFRKMISLPGVERIKKISHEEVSKRVGSILDRVEGKEYKNIFKFKYAGLKFVFKKGMKDDSIKLIKQYLVRYVGEKNVIVGPSIKPDKGLIKVNAYKRKISQAVFYLVISLLALINLSLLIVLFVQCQKLALVLEELHNRRMVFLKTSLPLFLILIVASLMLKYKLLVFLFGIFLILSFGRWRHSCS